MFPLTEERFSRWALFSGVSHYQVLCWCGELVTTESSGHNSSRLCCLVHNPTQIKYLLSTTRERRNCFSPEVDPCAPFWCNFIPFRSIVIQPRTTLCDYDFIAKNFSAMVLCLYSDKWVGLSFLPTSIQVCFLMRQANHWRVTQTQ